MSGARTRPALRPSDTIRLGSTGFYPVSSLNAGGVTLERRPDGITLAARRVDAGRVLQAGRTNSVGAADVYIVSADREVLCGSVLATTRNFQIK